MAFFPYNVDMDAHAMWVFIGFTLLVISSIAFGKALLQQQPALKIYGKISIVFGICMAVYIGMVFAGIGALGIGPAVQKIIFAIMLVSYVWMSLGIRKSMQQ
jgi:hypothetical protein